MLFEKYVPQENRDSYRRDGWTGVLTGIFMGATAPFIGFIARDKLHASVELISLITAAPFIGAMLALLYCNVMEGRRKLPFVAWPASVGRALFALMLFATTPLSFALVATAAYIILNLMGPAYAAVMKEIYPDKQRGQIMAYIRVGMTLAMFITTQIVARLLPYISYRYIFLIAAAIGVVTGIVFGTIRTAPVDPEEQTAVPFRTFLSDTFSILKEDRNFVWYSASVFVCGFGNLMTAPLYPVFQVDRLHITALQVGILSNATTLIWMLAYPIWGRYVDRRSPLTATAISASIVILVPITYFLATNVWMLLPTALFSGVVAAGTEMAYFNSILYFAREGKVSQYQALHSFSLGIRGSIAPFVGGALVLLLKNHGIDMRYVFLASAIMMAIGVTLQIAGVRMRYSEEVVRAESWRSR